MTRKIVSVLAIAAVVAAIVYALRAGQREARPRDPAPASVAPQAESAPASRRASVSAPAPIATTRAVEPESMSESAPAEEAAETRAAESQPAEDEEVPIISGRATIDGVPADEGCGLNVEWRHADGITISGCTIGPDGRFAFYDDTGPALDGYVVRTKPYHEIIGGTPVPGEDPDPHAHWLPGPSRDVELRLIERFNLKGRVVAAGTRDPIEGLVVTTFEADGETDTALRVGPTREGLFKALVPVDATRAVISVLDERRLGKRTITVNGPFGGMRDLGDIEVGLVTDVRLRVQDENGIPISGALAAVTSTYVLSEPTDDEGRTVIATDGLDREIRVAMMGFALAVVPVFGHPTEEITVTLRPAPVLVIEVLLADGTAPTEELLYAEIATLADTPLFPGADGEPDDLFERLGASSILWWDPENAKATISVPAGGHVIVGGLLPGTPVDVTLLGVQIRDVAASSHVVLPSRGTMTTALRTDRMPQTFAGDVRGPNGDRIRPAWIYIGASGPVGERGVFAREEIVQDDATFEIPGIFDLSVAIAIETDGSLAFHDVSVPVPPPGAVHTFVLTPAHSVDVYVAYEDGGELPEGVVVSVEEPGGGQMELDHEGGGLFVATGLASGLMEINVLVGATSVTVSHDTRTPVARVTLPRTGVAKLTWPAVPDGSGARLRVTSEDGESWAQDPAPADAEMDAQLPPGLYYAVIEFEDADGNWHDLAMSGWFEIASHAVTDVVLQ